METPVDQTQYLRITARIFIGGLIAAIVWYIGLLTVFGPAQQILADPAYQSQKFLEVFISMEPLPRMYSQPVAFYTGFLMVGIAFSFAYYLMDRWMPGKILKKGLLFGIVAWLLMNPWFEFYLPWNVMHEPILLVLFEMVLWLIVILFVGVVTASTHQFLKSKDI